MIKKTILRKFNFLLAGLLLCTMLKGQTSPGCGCDYYGVSACLNDTVFNGGDFLTVCYEVSDLINSSLGVNQDICGVRVNFMHSLLYGVEMYLSSPSGQSIQLVGPYVDIEIDDQYGTTFGTNWDVTFLPSNQTPNPDPGILPQWTNAQVWLSSATYNGSYFPSGTDGLESINGSANGQWCIQIDNTNLIQPYTGRILDFEVIFCDVGGLPCCMADAGELIYNDTDISGCLGDSSLILDIDPYNENGFPDTSYYDYGFIISDGDSLIIAIEEESSLLDYPPGDYTICGLSYLIEDSLIIDDLVGNFTLDSLHNLLQAADPIFCADVSSNCIEFSIETPPIKFDTTLVICEGDSIDFFGQNIMDAGEYSFTFPNPIGCDSIGLLQVNIDTGNLIVLSDTLCFGDSTTINNIDFYFETGIYEESFFNENGCDSIVRLDLQVLPENEVVRFDTICAGEMITIDGSDYDASGVYNIVLEDHNGCDSTIVLNLEVEEIIASIAGPNVLDCASASIVLDGGQSSGATDLIYAWTTSGGVIDSATDEAFIQVSGAGDYTLTVTSNAGCQDQVTSTILEDVNVPVISVADFDVLDCAVDTINLDASGSDFINSGIFEWTTADGNIIQGSNSPVIDIDLDGSYELTITDTINNCFLSEVFVVEIDTVAPPLSGLDAVINCVNPTVPLELVGNYAGPYNWVWKTSSGNVLPGSDNVPIFFDVSAEGIYILDVLNIENGCVTIDSVSIGMDTIAPNTILIANDDLDCANTSVLVNGLNSDPLSDFQVDWTAPIGGIESGDGTLSIVVDEAGQYIMEYTNLDNGCSSIDTIEIISNVEFEDIEGAVDNLVLDCENTLIQLGTDPVNPGGPGFDYSWYTIDGTSQGPGQILEVTEAGIYVMELLNQSNDCISLDTVNVGSIQREIIADVFFSNILTCDNPATDLIGSYTDYLNTDPITLNFTWYNQDGVLPGQDSLINVDQAGIYEFIVFDTFSNCGDTISIEVEKNTELPNPNAGADVALDCETGIADLVGSFSDDPSTHTSSWSTMDGNFLNVGEFDAAVDEIGSYTYTVTNSVNGCSFEDLVLVYLDTILCTPSLDTIPDVIVNCYNSPEVFGSIDATNVFDPNSNLTYSWSVVDGIIDGQMDTLIIKALIGTYVFEVTNPLFDFTSRDTIEIIDGRVYPEIDVFSDTLVVDCAQLEDNVELFGFDSSGSSFIQFQWESLVVTDIVSGSDSTHCLINAPGLYSLSGINTLTGCEDAASIFVDIEGAFPPVGCLPDNVQFDCDSSSIEIALDGCTDPNFEYNWIIETGQLEGPNGGASVMVSISNSPSTLLVEITDTTNHCTSADSLFIYGEGQCFPDCEISIPEVLNCAMDSVELVSIGSNDEGDFSYNWVTDIGNFCSATNNPTACVDSDGFYTLFVVDNATGLSCSSTILVEDDYSTLDAVINPIDSVNCYADSVNISFSVLDDQPFSVTWISPDNDCPVSEPVDGFYFARCGGDYGLVVASDETGCLDTFNFNIPMDTMRPIANLYSDTILDCSNPSLALLSSGSSSGIDFYYTFFNSDWDLLSEGVSVPISTTTNAGIHSLVVQDMVNGCKDTSFYEVIDNANIFEADAGVYPPLDCENPNLELQGSSDVFDNVVYYWEGDEDCFLTDPNNQNVTIDCPGDYVLVVLDTLTGCDDLAYVTISQDSDLPLSDSGPDVFIECTDDFVVLDGSGSDVGPNVFYSWYTEDGNITSDPSNTSIDVDEPGIYYLIVENIITACSDTSLVEVINGETFPIADAGLDLIIGCDQFSVQVDASNSSIGLDYNWTTQDGQIALGGNSLSPTLSAEGTYVLTVENNGCFDTDTLLVTLNTESPEAIITTFSNYINCVYDTITLTGLASTPAGVIDFRWYSAGEIIGENENSSIQLTQPDIYFLEILNVENNCRDTAFIEILESYAEPNLIYELPEALNCLNSVVTIDASASNSDNGILAALYGPQNATIINGNSLTPSVDTAGTYQLIIRDGFSLCSDTVSINVYEDYSQPELVLSSDPNVLCEVNDAVLDLSSSLPLSSISYQWFYENILVLEGDSIIEVDELGEYYVVGTSQINGCKDTLDIEVGAVGNPITDVLFSTEELDCYGDSDGVVTVESVSGGTAPYLYKIGDLEFGTYPQFLYLEAGNYMLEVEDMDGCWFEELIMIENPEELKVSLGDDQYIRYGELAIIEAEIEAINAVQKIEWGDLPFLNCSNCLDVEVGPSYTSIYDVLVVDDQLCEARDSVIIYVDESPGIFLPNTFNPNGSFENSVFGPFADESVALINDFRVFDRWGDMVFEQQNFQAAQQVGWDGSFDGKKVQSGVFVWLLEATLANGDVIRLQGSVALVQ